MVFGISGYIGSGKSEIGRIIRYITAKYAGNQSSTVHFSEQEYLEYKNNPEFLNTIFVEKKFADKLKDCVCLLLNCSRADLEDSAFKNQELGPEWWVYKFSGGRQSTLVSYLDNGYQDQDRNRLEPYLIKLTPRLLMQLLGTDAGRNIVHPDIWVNATMRDYKPTVIKGDASVTDVADENYPIWTYPKWVISDMRFPNELAAIKRHKGGFTIRVKSDVVRHDDGTVTPFAGATHESEIALDGAVFDYAISNIYGTPVESLIKDVHWILRNANVVSR